MIALARRGHGILRHGSAEGVGDDYDICMRGVDPSLPAFAHSHQGYRDYDSQDYGSPVDKATFRSARRFHKKLDNKIIIIKGGATYLMARRMAADQRARRLPPFVS